jgi:hypothetical protein
VRRSGWAAAHPKEGLVSAFGSLVFCPSKDGAAA